MSFLLAAAGGAPGSMGRYGIWLLVPARMGAAFPWAMLAGLGRGAFALGGVLARA